MSTSERGELDRRSKSASQGSGTVETSSRLPSCSEEHIDFQAAVSRSRQPRKLGFTVLLALRRTLRHRSASRRGRHELASLLMINRGVPKHTALVLKQASELATAHCPSARRCQRSKERFHEHRGRGSELPRVRWAAAGRPLRLRRALRDVPTVCPRTLPSTVMNRQDLTLLRRAGHGPFNPPLRSVRALSVP